MMTKIDEKDKKILEILNDHADYTTRQISKKIGLPITTVHNRIRKLRKEKIIKKFTVELDNSKVEKGFKVYILISVDLSILKEKKRSQYELAKELRVFPFMEKVDIVSGGTDLVATIRVKGVEDFDKVLLTKIQRIEGIEKTQSLIVIHEN